MVGRNKRYFVGIDVGGTHFAAGVVDDGGKLLAKHTMPTGAGRPFGVIVKEMADTARQLFVRAGLAESRISSVGIGVPSTIDSKTGRLIFANNLDWRDLDLIGEFRKSWDVPVYVENDADCAALAESMDNAAKGKNTLLITFGTGFGGGLIINGKIFKGGDNSGFEPGHFVLVHKGIQCTCGNYGCVEAYASVSALVRQTREKMQAFPDSLMWKECGADPEKVNGRTAFDAAKKGDAAAKEVVDAYIAYAALSIANLVTLFRPDLIIIGGGLSAEGDYLIQLLYETAKSRIYAGELLGMPPMVPARLGNDAGIIGAALLGTVHI